MDFSPEEFSAVTKAHPKNTMVHVVGLLPTDHKYFGSDFSCGHAQSALTEFKEAFIN